MSRFARPLAAALTCLLLSQCRHAAPTPAPVDPLTLLPPATQTGARTFGCLVNGTAYATTFGSAVNGDWQRSTAIFIGADTQKDGKSDGASFSIGVFLHGNLDGGQSFALVPFSKPVNTAVNEVVADAGFVNARCYYRGNYFLSGGRVQLSKFDGVGRIASGTFAFTLYEPGGCDTLRVTNGRFDIKF